MRHKLLPCLIILLLASSVVWALEPPKLTDRVMDLADVLNPQEEKALIQTLKAHEKASTQQFAVLTIPSLEGDPIEDFSIRTVEAWKLGTKEEDNGLLLLVAKEDRKMRIEVGYGLEGEVTDLLSNRIINEVMKPAFRQGDFAGGIQSAVDMLILAATGQEVNLPTDGDSSHEEDDLFFVIGLLICAGLFKLPILLAASFYGSPGKSSHPGENGWSPTLGGSGRFGGGFGGLSGGGGGFGGFGGGGGGFGGGGASGGW